MLTTIDYYTAVALEGVSLVNWSIVGIVAVFAALICCIMWMQDPRHLERAMARKLEKERVSDIVSAALQDACHRGDITPSVWHKYNKRLAWALGLDDMKPRQKVDLNRTKQLCRQRLTAMGVNIAQGLSKMRKEKVNNKKAKVLSSIKKAA